MSCGESQKSLESNSVNVNSGNSEKSYSSEIVLSSSGTANSSASDLNIYSSVSNELVNSSNLIGTSSSNNISTNYSSQSSFLRLSSSIPMSSSFVSSSSFSSSSVLQSSSATIAYGQLIDSRDNYEYKTVPIGNQTWISENIRFDTILGTGSKCYNNDVSNCNKYGRLYSWAVAMKVCPAGSRLPSNDEWNQMITYISNDISLLKSNSDWQFNRNGSDQYGFAALPAGNLYQTNYDGLNTGAVWWTSTECCTGNNWAYNIYFPNTNNYMNNTAIKDQNWYSVRCVLN